MYASNQSERDDLFERKFHHLKCVNITKDKNSCNKHLINMIQNAFIQFSMVVIFSSMDNHMQGIGRNMTGFVRKNVLL